MPDRIATQQALHTLCHPRAVAVIGASDDTTKHGDIVLNNIRVASFIGGIYGISRRLKEGDGIPCHPDLASLPEAVDAAFLAIPAEAAVQGVRDCAAAGLAAAIVGSAGYAESLEAGGAERQAELARIAAEAIADKLAQSSVGRLLASPRWQHPDAPRAFIELLLVLQNAAVSLGDRLEAVDINPVMLGAAAAVAVDALVVPRT